MAHGTLGCVVATHNYLIIQVPLYNGTWIIKFMFDFTCLYNKRGITLKKILLYLFYYPLHVTGKESSLAALA